MDKPRDVEAIIEADPMAFGAMWDRELGAMVPIPLDPPPGVKTSCAACLGPLEFPWPEGAELVEVVCPRCWSKYRAFWVELPPRGRWLARENLELKPWPSVVELT